MKKVLVITSIVLVVIAVIFLILTSRQTSIKNPILTNDISITPGINQSIDKKEYSDESGFKFKYSQDLTIATKENLDGNTYSSLLITSKIIKGKITLNVFDSTNKNIDDYLNTNEIFAKNMKDIKFGDIKAKQFENNGQTMTLALDKGVIFDLTLVAVDNKEKWIDDYNQIINSFVFVLPQADTQSETSVSNSNDQSSDVIYEGEEVVE